MKVCFETFGCRLNRAEALQQEADYQAAGWEVTHEHAKADLIIIRGCSVTSRAQRDCERLIDHLQRKYPMTRVRVEGCLRQKDKSPSAQKTKSSLIEIGRAVPSRTARAYLKVQDGCNGKCAFCIVPQFRGHAVSTPFQDCLDKAKRFIDAGYHEIVVTGCNLVQYLDNGKRLPDLLAALADLGKADRLNDSCRIRLGSIEPGPVAFDLMDVFAAHANICRFLHLSVQSASQRILTDMRRPYLIRDIEKLLLKTEQCLPTIGLGCDLITGFPGETDFDFLATKGFLKRMPFSNAHIFPYSSRPGTLAAGLPNTVPHNIRRARARELTSLIWTLRCRRARSFIDTDVDVLLEHETKLLGWTSEYFPCEISAGRGTQNIHRKDLVRVHITNVDGDRLAGVLIAED